MCTVLGVARSTYYKSFDKTKSAREVENEELKTAIIKIYKANRGIYGAPRIHHILTKEGFNVSIKRVQRRMTNDLVVNALKNAYYNQKPDENKHLIFHTDLCSQYTSNDLKELCEKLGIIQSFSKKGCPYDNACIESFHSSIKKEEIYRNTYRTFEEANIAIFKYI